MKDIALKAGVSVMTVSLALRGAAKISTATRDRIRELADEMGFRPDPALQALVAYRQSKTQAGFAGTIAYLNNTAHRSVVKRFALHRNFFNGARRRGAELGYSVEEFWLGDPGLSATRSSEILVARGIRGVLVGPMPATHANLALDWSQLAAVRLSFSLESPRLHAVRANHFLGLALCFRELEALGYRRIGLAINDEQDERTEGRYSGSYLAAQSRLPVRRRVPLLRESRITAESLVCWYRRSRPDAIIAAAADIRRHLESAGIRSPQHVGLAYPYTPPQEDAGWVACADGQQESVGAAAVDLLAGMLMRNERGVPAVPFNLSIDPVWKPGRSVQKQRPA